MLHELDSKLRLSDECSKHKKFRSVCVTSPPACLWVHHLWYLVKPMVMTLRKQTMNNFFGVMKWFEVHIKY